MFYYCYYRDVFVIIKRKRFASKSLHCLSDGSSVLAPPATFLAKTWITSAIINNHWGLRLQTTNMCSESLRFFPKIIWVVFLSVPINTVTQRVCVMLHLQAGNMFLVFSLSLSSIVFFFISLVAVKTEETSFDHHIYLQQELFFSTSITHQDAF